MAYVPDHGDVVWIDFDPQAGHEQAGRRPALILSPARYNGRIKLVILCPITSRVKGYPWEVPIPPGLPVSGVILSDQVKSMDWTARNTQFICVIPRHVVALVRQRLQALI